jgi:osmoprotectant transport system permease protein
MLGFLIPVSGVGNITAIIALTIYALLPMVRNTYTGLNNVDRNLIEAAEGMGGTKLQVFYKIKVPLAFPYIITGIRSMVIMTVSLAGIASFIGAGGLGVAIYRGITTNNTAMTINGSLMIAVLALLMDAVLGMVERKIKVRNKVKKTSSEKVFDFLTLVLTSILIIAIVGGTSIFTFSNKKIITIATKPMTEQYVLGNMLKILIEKDSNYKVKLIQGVGGGTSNIEPALEKGEIDLYPEYTGTGWNMVLKKGGLYTEDKFEELEKGYQKKGLTWTTMIGFNNTYGIAVRRELAKRYGLENYSDLSKVARKLVFGGEYDFFARADGFNAFCSTYNLKFKRTMDMDIGLKYKAIKQKSIDVMNIFTTDGQLAKANVVVLKDDLNFYPSYKSGIVARKDVLVNNQNLKNLIGKLNNLITDSEMVKMNYRVEVLKENPKEVAKDFLKEKMLLN